MTAADRQNAPRTATEEGYAFRLRPVEEADASFILDLRSDKELSRYLHPISPDLELQRTFIRATQANDTDYYFLIERITDQQPVGTIALYNIDHPLKQGEFGRWILTHDSLAALESAYLLYRFAFDTLGLNKVITRTVAENTSVVSFHNSFGSATVETIRRAFELRGRHYDAVVQELTIDG